VRTAPDTLPHPSRHIARAGIPARVSVARGARRTGPRHIARAGVLAALGVLVLATPAMGSGPTHPQTTRHPSASKASGGATPAGVLAPTPYMGWDSYFAFGSHYDEATVLEQASQLVTRGLARDGYNYVWLDVGWWQGQRNAAGEIVVNPTQWPHGMAWLASVLHAAGLRVGLYTDAGTNGCGGKGQGSYGHYQQDVNTFAAWGFDAVKVDYCGGIEQRLEPAAAYGAFHEAIVHNSSHRPMLLSICNFLQPGQYESEVPTLEGSNFASYTFGPSVGNSWRTDTDVGVPGDVEFTAVLRNLDADASQPQAAGPGHWNDPDYLGPDQGMTAAQFRTQFSMWAMLAAPLMISEDLVSMSSATQTAVSNREAIAIDQDPAGVQARLLSSNGSGEVWVKPLSNGTRAVALLNRSGNSTEIVTSAAAVGLPKVGGYDVRNVWTGAVTSTTGTIAASVPADSTVLLRVATAAQALRASPNPKRRG
jgi:alpha-galactosidase